MVREAIGARRAVFHPLRAIARTGRVLSVRPVCGGSWPVLSRTLRERPAQDQPPILAGGFTAGRLHRCDSPFHGRSHEKPAAEPPLRANLGLRGVWEKNLCT